MFEDGSVEYNEESLELALQQVQTFKADYGGAEIFNPLNEIFKSIKARNQHSVQTHIYLLTDGAVHNN